MGALHAIASIELRSWPDSVALFNFSESFESDAKRVKTFCRDQRIFGRNAQTLVKKWDVVTYLATPIFLYYLPAILLAVLEHPRSQLASVLLLGRFTRDLAHFTQAEATAVELVTAYLMTQGVSKDSIRKEIEEGRAILRGLKSC